MPERVGLLRQRSLKRRITFGEWEPNALEARVPDEV
jgi:hypothetical protein